MENKLYKKVLIIMFSVMILLPLLTFNFKEGKISEAENKTLESFPQIFTENGLNKHIAYQLIEWFEDNLGLREEAIVTRRSIINNIYHQSANTRVEEGLDGFLFLNDDNNLQIASGTYPDFDSNVLERINNNLIKANDYLKDLDIDFVFMSPPSKTSIYPEYIQSGDYTVRITPSDDIINYLSTNSDIKLVNLKQTLLKEKDGSDLLYFKSDTHWNYVGRYIAYEEIINKFNEYGLCETSPVDVEYFDDEVYGDLYRIISSKSKEECKNYKIINQSAYKVVDGEDYETFSEFLYNSDQIKGSYYKNDEVSGKNLMIFGDSMMNCLLPLLAENFEEVIFVWSYEINEDMIDYYMPDIVILDVSERLLNTMVEYNN